MQPLLYLRNMTYAAMYNCVRHLPDVRYEFTSRVTTVGNVLPAVAFLSRDRHTAVFTGPYPGPEGPDTRYTSVSGTKRSWLCYHRDIYNIFIIRFSFSAFKKISKELKELTPQVQHLRKNLRQRSKYCKKHNSF